MNKKVLFGTFVPLALGACASPEPGGDLRIAVAPLTLPGLVDACYSLTVTNEAGQVVWSEPEVCAARFGDGAGSITYIGTCDDSDGPDPDTVSTNIVTLRVNDLFEADGPDAGDAPDALTDWVDPCDAPSAPDGCQLAVTCRENEDARVEFDLTIMRNARQGFFDVAVNFEDIYCSAKVDCAEPDGDPIRLLFDAAGERVDTLVFALACTDGDAPGTGEDAAAASTHLYLDDLELVCDDDADVDDDPEDATPPDRYLVDPSDGPGNLYPGGVGAPTPLVQAAVYEGREALPNGGGGPGSADKVYWNVALGLSAAFFTPVTTSEYAPPFCRLRTRATASRGPLDEGTTPTDANYPYIAVDVAVSDPGGVVCTQHPLGRPDEATGVAATYTGPNDDSTGFVSIALSRESAPVSASAVDSHSVVPGFTRVPRGRFVAGPDNWFGTGTTYEVELAHDFWLGETEVTQGDWTSTFAAAAARPDAPWWVAGVINPSAHVGASLPVEQVSFYDILAYANALSFVEGRELCYDLSACVGTVGIDFRCDGGEDGGPDYPLPPFVGLDCDGYRLPSDAEWEYAARADDTQALPPGADFAWLCEAPDLNNDCYDPNYSYDRTQYWGETQPVGTKAANFWGLHDTIGNVYEITNDTVIGVEPPTDAVDPDLYAETLGYRLRSMRGRGYYDNPAFVSVTDHYMWDILFYQSVVIQRSFDTGFRLARRID